MGLLSVKEAWQHAILSQFEEGKLSEKEACERLSCHRSTLYRKALKLHEKGPEGLIHQLRGKTSNAQEDPAVKKAVCDLFDKDYRPHGFRVAHFYQDALPQFPKPVGYSTVIRWLRTEGLTQRAGSTIAGDRGGRPSARCFRWTPPSTTGFLGARTWL